ncbi:probable multidrug resistance-associated protein lethal(2)03659 isoform X2 [Diabrotica virgifera virgifera]|uniref:Probable multidrug resistance-associated protein lethal(2)03659 n=1 Tax=Diabrotica virgifera virgifera TaxID=50390 RepID=A0A6P7FXM7_DIAVI|nr:probable multidrug resistance-associated protein lethal(2)03659 isoform X2 [Diabrotica virgifera virgifera]KAI2474111.1 ATP binding cassette (ABC) transporter subfamily C member [Diabrotica virgifera virgifera]
MGQFKQKKVRQVHPIEQSSLLSKITFLYTLPIFWKTHKRGTFEEDELYEVLKKCKAEEAGNEVEKCIKDDVKNHGYLSLFRILCKCYGLKYFLLGMIQVIVRSIVIITIPLTLSKVIKYFQPGQDELSRSSAIYCAILLVLLNFLSVTYLHNYLLVLSELGIKVRTAFCSAIFRKSLRLTQKSLLEVSSGKIVTLMTKDVAAIENFIFYFNDVWVGIVQAIIVFYLIFNKMGVGSLIGIGFFLLVIPAQVLLGKLISKLRLESSKKTDERLQTTKEMLSGISTIKMNVWEFEFEHKINQTRKKEMKAILKIFLAKTTVLLIGSLTSKIAYYLLLTTFILLGNTISAELVYYITTLFLRIRHALNVAIPIGVTVTADMSAAMKRIQQMMTAEEVIVNDEIEVDQKKSYVSLNNLSIEVDDKVLLKDITLRFDSGLYIISGSTGSGKTVLLKSILGEFDTKSDHIIKYGTISYAAQEPWIFPATFKQNIVFDEPFDEERYNRILDICALGFDIEHFTLANDLKIGDKGANLSKGQKSRINLARALYRNADIYLIDDCLSSLDVNVQRHVFQKCIREFLSDKICIFVTQNLQYTNENDKIIVLNEGKTFVSQNLSEEDDQDIKTILKKEQQLKNLIEVNNNADEVNNDETTEESSLLKKLNIGRNNMYQENKKSGKVDFYTYRKYGNYGGGILVIAIVLVFFIGSQFSKSYTEKILSNWVNHIHHNTTNINEENTVWDFSLKIYSAFTLSTTILSIFSAFLLFNFTRKASIKLHRCLSNTVINATMKFFDSHLIGNIINRFSKDLSIVDEQIPFAIYEFLEIVLSLCGVIILITLVNVGFIIPTAVVFILLYFLRKLYLPTGRNLQRLDTAVRSPMLGHLNSSLEGLSTIRAFKAEETISKEFDRHQDLYTSANYTSKCCQRAFGYYLDVCCTTFIGAIIAAFIIVGKETAVGDVGLAITQAFMLNGIAQYAIRLWADIENKMTSVERILEYVGIKTEDNDLRDIFKDWTSNNIIQYKNVNFRYDNSQQYILKNINITINKGEKVGIIGRTGSGKSSLITLLLRLFDYEGKITIGNEDIQSLPLTLLRSKISIISQDPVLFSGTIKSNMAPKVFGVYPDEDIWKVIHKLELTTIIDSLDFQICEGGKNLSAGQRQLICLARCLLHQNKIILLDEATSEMDQGSESLFNNILEKQILDCYSFRSTVIVVAHSLKTILNCDRVLVVQNGEIVENGAVSTLAQDEQSLFYNMLKSSGLLTI